MDYKKAGQRIYIRLDKDDEVIASLTSVCMKEGIQSAVFNGIGACDKITVGTYIEEKHDFLDHKKEGMFEMTSLIGNVTTMKDGSLHTHAHAMFAYLDDDGEVKNFGGHLDWARICYTGEIVMDVTEGFVIGRKQDPQTGIEVWDL